MTTRESSALLAGALRETLGHLIRRLRAEHGFPLSQGSVLGRLSRGGKQSISDLAVIERVRPQSMAQTVRDLETAGLVVRHPDPDDRRRAFVELTPTGHAALDADRRHRDGWLAQALERDLSAHERDVLEEAVGLLRRLASS